MTHQEFLRNANLSMPANVGTQVQLTNFLRQMTSRQSVVLPQISRWSLLFPTRPAQKIWCRVIIYVQEHTIQGQVSNRFSWNLHARCGSTHWWTPLFLETIGPIEPPIRENVFPKPVFLAFIKPAWNFLWKNPINSIWYPIPHRKGSTHFCRRTPTLPQKWSRPPKNYFSRFAVILENMFFLKKLFDEKYLKTHFLQKKLYWFLLLDALFNSKQPCPPVDGSSQFLQKMWRF